MEFSKKGEILKSTDPAKKDETLSYQRVAVKSRDGYAGYLYLHTWDNGYQHLIFQTREIEKWWTNIRKEAEELVALWKGEIKS